MDDKQKAWEFKYMSRIKKIEEMWDRLQLTKEEDIAIAVDKEELKGVQHKGDQSISSW